MNRSQSFIPHAQSPKLVQPRDGTFNNPPCFPKIAAMAGTAPGNLMTDTSTSQELPMCTAVISAIGLHTFRFAQRTTAFAANWHDAVEQWH